MKKLWDLKNDLSYLELEGQGRGIIMEVTRPFLLRLFYFINRPPWANILSPSVCKDSLFAYISAVWCKSYKQRIVWEEIIWHKSIFLIAVFHYFYKCFFSPRVSLFIINIWPGFVVKDWPHKYLVDFHGYFEFCSFVSFQVIISSISSTSWCILVLVDTHNLLEKWSTESTLRQLIF